MSARTFRTAGVAALVAAAAYLVQPMLVAFSTTDESVVGTAAHLAANTWHGVVQGLVFVVLGVAFAVTVQSIDEGRRTLGAWLGKLSAGVWVVVGGLFFGQYSSVGAGVSDLTGDPVLQRLVTHTADVVNTGLIAVAAIGFAGWAVSPAVREVLGRTAAVAGIVAAVVVGVPLLVWSQPWGVLVMIPHLLLVGVLCLIRARRPVPVG